MSAQMVHALTIFISAFLLFLVQLIIGKRILPWFGGAPAVWTTCMLFFQLLLLGGYAYAHFLAARFSAAAQARIHSALLVCSVGVLTVLWSNWGVPILPDESWKPQSSEQPVWQILKLLTVSVGLPYFILASTSPLIQRWYSFKADISRTYRLYALSNVGSMMALLAYPFLIEPWTRLPTQGGAWGVLYILFALGCLGCAWQLRDRKTLEPSDTSAEEQYQKRPSALVLALWLLLAAITSAMLLSVTNNLCQEVAVVPFLWVFPLLIYLLSFVICFDSPRWYSRRWFVLATAASSIVVLITAFRGVHVPIVPHVISYGLFLFLFCVTCHGELVRLKPGRKFLTLFYLTVAMGGAVGGLFVGLVAPLIFNGFYEFHFVMLAGWIVLAIVFYRDKSSFFFTGDRLHIYLLVFVASYLGLRLFFFIGRPTGASWFYKNLLPVSLLFSLVLVGLFILLTRNMAFVRSKLGPRILIGAVIFFAECFMLNRVRSTGPTTIDVQRNFYGVTRVERKHVDAGTGKLPLLQLAHGQISHGLQFLDSTNRMVPVSYYSPSSGIGAAFAFHARRASGSKAQLNVGVLGLGVGTLASYGKEGDQFRFYEINRVVADYSLAAEPFFTYLRDSKSKSEVIMGDARLSLERELRDGGPNQFDILVMDAFSSDSVPVHLLTSEAFALYLEHLRDDKSIIAVNISNRFLDFRDLMASTARKIGFGIVTVETIGDLPHRTPSRWCLLTRDQDFLQNQEVKRGQIAHTTGREIVWTDDFSNLFRLVK